jgi:hypothetical protein
MRAFVFHFLTTGLMWRKIRKKLLAVQYFCGIPQKKYLCGSGHDKCGIGKYIAKALALAMCPVLSIYRGVSSSEYILQKKKTDFADVCRSVSCITTFVISFSQIVELDWAEKLRPESV